MGVRVDVERAVGVPCLLVDADFRRCDARHGGISRRSTCRNRPLRSLRRRGSLPRVLAGSGRTGSYTEQAMSITVKLPDELAALLAEEAAR